MIEDTPGIRQFFGINTGQMTNDELAQVISELRVVLARRCKNINIGSPIKNVMEAVKLETAARTPQGRKNMRMG